MSRHERRYQKYLDRKRQKHGYAPAGSEGPTATSGQVAAAALSPIHEALVPANLFELGIGNLFFSRSLPDARIVLAGFLLDTYCLGVKNALINVVSRAEYAMRRSLWSAEQTLQPMQPACFRKLVEGGVAYARDLGLEPHGDYALASQIFGDVQAADCSMHFAYGRDGKPFYVAGPHDTPEHVDAIIAHLERRVGEGNFHYLVPEG